MNRANAPVLAVEPSEHDRWPEHATWNSTVNRKSLLPRFALGIEVVSPYAYLGRADADHIRHVVTLRGHQHISRRGYGVVSEGLRIDPIDLGMIENKRLGT
jgi:hypothetical protein